jgi:TolB-like protein
MVIALLALVVTTILVGFGLSRRRRETALASPKTIAVLPFKPLSTSSRDESLELGMAETLITRLSNISQIVVRPMASVRKYTDPHADPVKIGQEVQAEAVLDGSIQKADGRVRVTVRLTDVRNGATLWAEQFDESFTDIFKVQDSISDRVARALPIRLSSEESLRLAKRYTDNSEAYELYLHSVSVEHQDSGKPSPDVRSLRCSDRQGSQIRPGLCRQSGDGDIPVRNQSNAA